MALYFREDLQLLAVAPPALRPAASRGELLDPGSSNSPRDIHDALRERLTRGACFFADLLVELGEVDSASLTDALWDLVWAGEVTNDAVAPLRAPRLSVARGAGGLARMSQPTRASRFAKRGRAAAATHVQGRWSLTAQLFPSAAVDPVAKRRALAELLLERYGILTREQVSAEGVVGGFSAIYPELTQLETLGIARRGYFVEGLGGAQFALPGAVERLRERPPREEQPLVLSAVDPAQPYGAALPWPKRAGRSGPAASQRAPARQAGALLVLTGGEPILYLERGGKSLQTLVEADDPRLLPALAKLVEHIRAGRGALRRLGLEKVDGESALSSPLGSALIANGFQEGPRRLTLSA